MESLAQVEAFEQPEERLYNGVELVVAAANSGVDKIKLDHLETALADIGPEAAERIARRAALQRDEAIGVLAVFGLEADHPYEASEIVTEADKANAAARAARATRAPKPKTPNGEVVEHRGLTIGH